MSYPVNTRLHVVRGTYKDSVGRVLMLPINDRPVGLPAEYIALGFDKTTSLVESSKERKVKGDDLQVLWFAPGQVQLMEVMAPAPAHPDYTEADFERQQDEIAAQRAAKNQVEMDAYNAASEADTRARFPKDAFVRIIGGDYDGSVGQVTGRQNGHIVVKCSPWNINGHRLLKKGKVLKGGWGGHTVKLSECDLQPCDPYTAPAQ